MSYPVAVLASGTGTNLQALIDACASAAIDARIVYVATNRENVPALVRAQRAGIPHGSFTIKTYGTRAAAHEAMADAVVASGARLVVLAGFDHILAPAFFVKLAGVPVINIHPALLPMFGGKGMLREKVHEAVLAAKAKESGATVHRVHPDTVDLGEVIVQLRCPVLESDDVQTLAARVLAVEHEAIVEAVRRCIATAEAAPH